MALDWSSLQVVLGRTGHVRCEPGWRLDAAWSDGLQDFDLWLVWAGQGRMTIDAETFEIRPGFCLWMRPGRQYAATHDPRNRLGVNYVHFDLLDASGRRVSEGALPPVLRPLPDAACAIAITSRIVELSRGNARDAATAAALLRGVLMDLERDVGMPARTAPPQHQACLQAAGRMREDPSRDWSVTALATEAGYSPDHFSRMFQAALGQAPRDFLITCRVERAQSLLRETTLSIEQVARTLRYSSVFFFSRQFKSRTGLSPARWRLQSHVRQCGS